MVAETEKVEGSCCASAACDKECRADSIIRKHVYAAAGAGLIPLPYFDLVGILGVQLNMVNRIAEAYDVPFKKEMAKGAIGALAGSVSSIAISGPLSSALKMIPLIGTTTGAISLSISGGAITYALGKVFVQHFASGGTFLDFNPSSVREYFAQQLKEGKNIAQAARK